MPVQSISNNSPRPQADQRQKIDPCLMEKFINEAAYTDKSYTKAHNLELLREFFRRVNKDGNPYLSAGDLRKQAKILKETSPFSTDKEIADKMLNNLVSYNDQDRVDIVVGDPEGAGESEFEIGVLKEPHLAYAPVKCIYK